ncbi:hypothetical protein BGX28_007889 [Mortierella sp. GBA30]|nr:hypothetical protein BGX28_007889 [Mortierella sp. GBA30]
MSSAQSPTSLMGTGTYSSSDPSTFGGNENSTSRGTFASGGFIYIILVAGILTAIIYFTKVCLVKRQARLRSLKDPDFGPPTYLHHFDDLQVIDARPRQTSVSGQLVVPSPPASALVRGENYYIVTPRTHTRTGSSSSSASESRKTPGAAAGDPTGASGPTAIAVSSMIASETAGILSEPLPPAYDDLTPRETAPLVKESPSV